MYGRITTEIIQNIFSGLEKVECILSSTGASTENAQIREVLSSFYDTYLE